MWSKTGLCLKRRHGNDLHRSNSPTVSATYSRARCFCNGNSYRSSTRMKKPVRWRLSSLYHRRADIYRLCCRVNKRPTICSKRSVLSRYRRGSGTWCFDGLRLGRRLWSRYLSIHLLNWYRRWFPGLCCRAKERLGRYRRQLRQGLRRRLHRGYLSG